MILQKVTNTDQKTVRQKNSRVRCNTDTIQLVLSKMARGGRIFINSFEASLQSGNIVANRHNNCNMV